MTYTAHGLTAMSSPSVAKLVCGQLVICVLFHISTDCVANVEDHGMKVNNQSYQSSL